MAKETEKNVPDHAEVVTRMTRRFMAASGILSVLVFLGGCSVLLGWALDIPALKSVLPNLVSMKANTALCFVFSGLSLWLFQTQWRDQPRFQWMAKVFSLGVFVVGLLTLSEYLFRRDLGIDQFLFKELPGAIFTSSPGRMAFNTAMNFTLTGLALFFLAARSKKLYLFSQIAMIPVGLASALAFIGYIYGALPLILGLNFSTAMALHTMVLFVALFFGILCCRPACGIMTLVSSETVGGKMIRRIFPMAVLLPIVLGFLKLQGERTGVITNEFGVSFVAIGNLSLMLLYVYMLSFWIDKSNLERLKAEKVVRASEEKYRGLFENSRDAIMILKPPLWKFVSGNPATVQMFRVKNEDEFISLGPWDLSPERQPDGSVSSEKAMEMIDTAMRKGFHSFEWTHKRLHSEEFPAMVRLTRIGLGQEMILLATVRDITERKRGEVALKQKVEELECFNRVAVGRELKMIELKARIKALEDLKK